MSEIRFFHLFTQVFRKIWLQLLLLALFTSGHLLLEFLPDHKKHTFYPKILSFLSVWVAAWIVSRLIAILQDHAKIQAKLAPNVRTLVFIFIKGIIYSLAFLVALDSIGISITPLLASLGVGSLAVGLALQDTLGNLFSGFYLYLDRPIAIGDWIKHESGVEGRVVSIGWRSTQLLVGGENMVIIPNSKLSTSIVTNFSLPIQQSTVAVTLGVAYESDLERVEQIVLAAAKRVMERTPGAYVQAADSPQVRFQKFGDSGLELTLSVKVGTFSEMGNARHDLIKEVQSALRRESVAIPYPKRLIQINA